MLTKFHQTALLLSITSLLLFCNCQDKGRQNRQDATVPETTAVAADVTDATPNRKNAVMEEGKVTALTTAEFRKKVFDFQNEQNWKFEGDQPCIIDFYADWCRPCKAMEPIMEKLAKEYAGQVRFYKVNVDQEGALANYFQINSIPFILYCPLDDMPKSTLGGLSEEQLRQYIEMIR